MRSTLLLVIASTSLASGCASIVGGTGQVVSVETHQAERPVDGARCEMVNSKGTYYVTTPGTVTIGRAYGNLTVRCDKDGMDAGQATVVSATKALAFGNILFGGAIGVVVDTSSGAAYDYPELIRVSMGESVVIDARNGGGDSGPVIVASGTPASGAATSGNPSVPAVQPSAPVQPGREPKRPTMDDLRDVLPR
ncbi:Translation initiation factor 2 [Ralstonia mannitolilytica]|nr:hypothetical protein R76706_01046 [Ralstonia mannitolilytica]CAJ0797585.1 hypothetical protein R77555_03089 [Ralstonia mannitolilytica]